MKNLKPRIKTLSAKKLLGNKAKMSVINNKTKELWRKFIPRQAEISNKLTSDMISLQVYDSSYFDNFNPTK